LFENIDIAGIVIEVVQEKPGCHEQKEPDVEGKQSVTSEPASETLRRAVELPTTLA
jgi:hypothetical protein